MTNYEKMKFEFMCGGKGLPPFMICILLATFFLSTCGSQPIYDSENEYPEEANSFDEQAEGGVDIFGAWIYVKTIIDNGEPHQINEFTFIPPRINICSYGALSAKFWETSINAIVVMIGDYEFLVTEQIASSEGEQWYPGDVALLYDVENVLLRWTLFDQFSDMYIYHFFARPHPFSVALSDYMAAYDGVIRAFLVTLDDFGSIGMFVAKTPELVLFDYDLQEYYYSSVATLFFMDNDDLHQVGASGLFVSGRYNRLMTRLYAHTHIVEFIYVLENGQLHESTRLEYFEDDYLLYLSGGNFGAERNRRDALREKNGLDFRPLPNPWLMENMQDQTDKILAMTINCTAEFVPEIVSSSWFFGK